MSQQLRHRLASRATSHRTSRDERGFTLIELLVVIIILGILSGVVVFAVGGIGDKGQGSAVAIDKRTIETAQEAYCAKNGAYGTMSQLTGDTPPFGGGPITKLLSEPSTYNAVVFVGGGRCGSDPLTSGYVVTSGPKNPTANGGGPFIVGFGAYAPNATPNLLNPAVNTQGGMQAASGMLFNGLIGLSASAEAVPELAESWVITGGGTAYKFTLTPGVRWSNGQPLLAEDVKFSYEAGLLIWHARTSSSLPSAFAAPCMDPGPATGARRLNCSSIVANESDATAGGKRTVTFNFAQAFGPLLQQMPMTDGAIIPKHIFPACNSGFSGAAGQCPTTAQPWPTGQPPVGTGPFIVNVNETNTTTGLVYNKNPFYSEWRSGVPYFNKVILSPINTLAALQSGAIDYLPGLASNAAVATAKADASLVVDTGTMAPGGSTNCTQTVMFNLWANSQSPAAIRAGTATPDQYLGDPTPIDPDGGGPEPMQPRGRVVRRALAMALQREPNVNGANPGYVSISGSPGASLGQSPTNSGMPVGSTSAPLPVYDRVKAETFLDAAGFPRSPAVTGSRFTLGLSSFAGYPLANAMQQDLAGVGVTIGGNPGMVGDPAGSPVSVLVPAFGSVGPLFAARNFDILIVSSCQNTDPEMGTRRVYHTDAINGASFTNGSGYNNATVNNLFNVGRASTDIAIRNAAYRQINDIVATDLPTLWLLQTKSNRAYKAKCTGLRPYTGAYSEYGSCVR